MNQRPRRLRIRKWIKPRLQLKLIGSFLMLSVALMVMQFMLFSTNIMRLPETLPGTEEYAEAIISRMMQDTLLLSAMILIPLTLLVGGIVTHRIAGPVYRFEQFLTGVIAGTQVGPCKLRKRDELKELCDIITKATEPLRLELRGAGPVPVAAPSRAPSESGPLGPESRAGSASSEEIDTEIVELVDDDQGSGNVAA